LGHAWECETTCIGKHWKNRGRQSPGPFHDDCVIGRDFTADILRRKENLPAAGHYFLRLDQFVWPQENDEGLLSQCVRPPVPQGDKSSLFVWTLLGICFASNQQGMNRWRSSRNLACLLSRAWQASRISQFRQGQTYCRVHVRRTRSGFGLWYRVIPIWFEKAFFWIWRAHPTSVLFARHPEKFIYVVGGLRQEPSKRNPNGTGARNCGRDSGAQLRRGSYFAQRK